MSHEAHEMRGAQPSPVVLALLLAAALGAALTAGRRREDRAAIAAVDASEFAALTGRPAAADEAFWERLKAMGVGAAVLREETLADLAARGEVAYFPPQEVARWRAAGILPPSSGARAGELWTRDAAARARAVEALAVAGVDASTATMPGALILPPGVDLTRLPAGFDPGEVAAVSSAGLLPVAASSRTVEVAGAVFWTSTLFANARPGAVARAAFGRTRRLIVFRAVPGLGLEENLDALRSALKALRALGLSDQPPAPGSPAPAAGVARLAAIWLIGLAGPLLAARAGLLAARFLRHPTRAVAPLLSPVPQTLAGLVAAWACAALAGLAAAGLAGPGWRDGGARAWMVWTWCAPLVVAASALAASRRPARRGWAAPVRRRDLLGLALFAAAAILLSAPRAALRASALWEGVDRLSAVAGALWWWPWRWREALVGAPALTLAYALIEERDGAAAGAAPSLLATPGAWIVLGLMAPAGLIAAVGGGGEPAAAALRHGALAQAFGAVLGAAAAGLRDLFDS